MADIEIGYTWSAGSVFTASKMNDSVNLATIVDEAVTLDKLAASVIARLVPAGAIQAYAMNSAPTGWLACDGSAILRATYADLFTAISTVYGVGDGSTTFNIPDLRGYFLRGAGTNSDGTEAGTFGAKIADELKAHTHNVSSANGASAGGAFGYLTGSNSFVQSGSTGGTETRPKNIAMLYCIKH